MEEKRRWESAATAFFLFIYVVAADCELGLDWIFEDGLHILRIVMAREFSKINLFFETYLIQIYAASVNESRRLKNQLYSRATSYTFCYNAWTRFLM